MLVRNWILAFLVAFTLTCGARAFMWPNAAERIERQLGSELAPERRLAAHQIVDLPQSVAERLVPRALKDPDMEVRLAALDAALRLRIRGVSDLVIPWLNDPERRVRMAAIELLRVNPSDAAIAPLGRTLSDPDPAVRQSAAEALGASKASGATLHLLSHLDDSVPRVREAIARALARLGDPRAVVPLIGKVQDSQASVRASVARALGELGDARASAALILALGDNDQDVRSAAARSLGRLGQPSAILSLVSLMEEDDSVEVKAAAVWALGAIGSDAAVEALLRTLGSRTGGGALPAVREATLDALVMAGAKAEPALTLCVKDELVRARADGCAVVLGRLGSKAAVPVLAEALRAGRVERAVALAALGQIGDRAGLPAALEYLTAPDSAVRIAAIEASGRLLAEGPAEGRAVEPIKAALKSPDILSSERAALAKILGLTRSKRAARPLMAIAEDADDLGLKRAALEALGSLGPAGQQRVLLDAIGDEEPSVRFAAALALAEAPDPATAGELLRRLSRAAEQDRSALLLALTGAMRVNSDPQVTKELAELAWASRGGGRDALLEALGNATTENASSVLQGLLTKPASVEDRAKIAEALGSEPHSIAQLLELSRDPDGSVRANAVWALGSVATAREQRALVELMKDRDVAVAGNAAAALGRLALRTKAAVTADLCAALRDRRSYVRANALGALRLAGQRCAGEARDLVRTDPSAEVRLRAAALLVDVPAVDPKPDQEALRRCVMEDPIGRVAARCKSARTTIARATTPVTVLVVPGGESSPTPRAPFALSLSNGLLRLGVTDRRGAVFERAAPNGELALRVPAPLAQ